MEERVTCQAALISQGCYELVTQVVRGFRRVVIDARGGQSAGEDFDTNGSRRWQSIRAEHRNSVGVRRVTAEIMHAGRKGIDYAAVRQRIDAIPGGRAVVHQGRRNRQPGVAADARRNSELFAVKAQAVTA